MPTRRFHGLLVAALPAPLGRMMMLNHLAETLVPADGAPIALTGFEGRGGLMLPDALVEVALENGLSGLDLRTRRLVLEKRIVVTHRQNTVRVAYRLAAGDRPARLALSTGAVAARPTRGAST